jgi:hypothetical protein
MIEPGQTEFREDGFQGRSVLRSGTGIWGSQRAIKPESEVAACRRRYRRFCARFPTIVARKASIPAALEPRVPTARVLDFGADRLGRFVAIAVDGKTLRGSFDAFSDRKAAHMMSALRQADQIVLGHLIVAEKSNEAAPELIEALGVKGCVFTLDAEHAQKNRSSA